jgi:uncharacterized SAM-binding protein YcdF (DUF218 family)
VIRLAFRLVSLLVAAVVVYLVVTFIQVTSAAGKDQARRVDAIVVFGAAQYQGKPSKVLAARLDHTADLYKKGYGDRVFVTGGKAPGDVTTEASTSAAYLAKLGVPDSAILREVSGRNSWQSLANAAAALKARGLTKVLLVSDPFHDARIEAMAKELGLEPYVSPTRSSPIKGTTEQKYMAKETVAVAAGRIVGFRRLMGVDSRVKGVQEKVGTG